MASSGDAATVSLSDLSNFKLIELLQCESRFKTAFIHAKYVADPQNPVDAVIILEQPAFDELRLESLLCDKSLLKQKMSNNVYSQYGVFLPPELNEVKAQVILPCTQQHIDKYRSQQLYVVSETPHDYKTITLPHIQEKALSIEWVYNILEHKAEQDRILYEDTNPEIGFILAPDFKWDGKDLESFYCTAICHKRGIKSIRDLTSTHLPLLENIMSKSTEIIQAKFGLKSSELRIYFHYQPTFYHLHVHLVNIRYDAPGTGVTKAHLVRDVIDNIKLQSDFYQGKTLTFHVKEGEQLYQKFKEADRV